MLTTISLFLASKLGRYVFTGGVLLALFVGYTMKQRQIGAERAVAKIEKATNDAIGKANSAGSKSAAGRAGLSLNFRD